MSYLLENILKRTKEAIKDFHMIEDTEGIMVGLSGGKDSITLLYVLHQFWRSSKYKYPLAAGHVSMGWDTDITPLEEFCRSLDIPFYFEPTKIGPIVFDVRNEKNPCSLCAKMRRGALNNLAKNNGYNKVALAHHMDDAVETILLKMFYEGRIESFSPVTYLDRRDITVIRPLIYVPEHDIKRLARSLNLPVIENPCPANGYTRRQDMKEIIKLVEKNNPLAKERAITALKNMTGEKSWKQ
ncbi:MAG: tRNA lysidine(34) synthetase [Bacillota bacterium]